MKTLRINELLPPRFVPPPVVPPVTVLRQVALLLAERTEGAVRGEVVLETLQTGSAARPLGAQFLLHVPALVGYKMPLFRIEASANAYPVRLQSEFFADFSQSEPLDDSDRVFLFCHRRPEPGPLVCDCSDEEDFFRLLRLLFFSKAAARLIGSLIGQSQPWEPESPPAPPTEPAPAPVATEAAPPAKEKRRPRQSKP
jgi:hypothetical protein